MSNPSPDPELDRLTGLAQQLDLEHTQMQAEADTTITGSPLRVAARKKEDQAAAAWRAVAAYIHPTVPPDGPASTDPEPTAP